VTKQTAQDEANSEIKITISSALFLHSKEEQFTIIGSRL